ncbi:MAG: C40 family peptidase, partial [Sphingomonadales bacterium]
ILDGYEGFIDHKQVLPLTDKELRRWLDQFRYAMSPTLFIQGPMGPQLLSGGALVGAEAEFEIGSYYYQIQNELVASDCWSYALSFLNTPYLWGGKSHFGVDCSGLVQNVFRQLQFNLPRDAYQQATHGQMISFEERQILDLAFFKNADGRIHHVGIIGPEDQILHASGQVRIDTLTQEGIFNASAAKITHSLYQIRRLF